LVAVEPLLEQPEPDAALLSDLSTSFPRFFHLNSHAKRRCGPPSMCPIVVCAVVLAIGLAGVGHVAPHLGETNYRAFQKQVNITGIGKITLTDVVWGPLPDCDLPIPQPLYMEASFNMLKTGLLSLVLGVDSLETWANPVALWQWALTIVFGLYQVVGGPFSVGLLLLHFAEEHDLSHVSWKTYECFGACFVTSSFIVNFVTTICRYILMRKLLERMEAWSQGCQVREEKWRSGKGLLTSWKVKLLFCSVCSNAVVVGLLMAPYTASHILPGVAVFLPEMAVLVTLGAVFSYHFSIMDTAIKVFLRPNISGEQLKQDLSDEQERAAAKASEAAEHAAAAEMIRRRQRDMEREQAVVCRRKWKDVEMAAKAIEEKATADKEAADAKKTQAELEKASEDAKEGAKGFTFALFCAVPLIVALRVVIETSFLQMAYLYAGTPYLTAMGIAWTERKIMYYIPHVFFQAIACSTSAVPLWYSAQLYLEAF